MPSEDRPPSGDAVPPVLPPPLPAPLAVPPVISNPERRLYQGRLHPLTLVFAGWEFLRNFLIPLVVLLFFGSRREGQGWLLMGMAGVGIPLGLAMVRYFTFTYRIDEGELITTQGLLGRTERHIPLTRVQDIRIEQGVLQRLFKVAEVHVETAGGSGPEASLSVLSRAEAERLRAAVFERMTAPTAAPGADAAAPAPLPEVEVIRRLSLRELVLEGLTSSRVASVLVVLAVAWQYLDDVLPEAAYKRLLNTIAEGFNRWAERAGDDAWLQVVLVVLGVALVSLVLSVIGAVIAFHGFTLSRRGEDLHRAWGLLTRRSSSLPRRRIQVLKIEEQLLRRWLKLATVRADTAGGAATRREGKEGRDVLLPIVRGAELEHLVPVFFPDMDPPHEGWQQVSRRAIRRGTVKGAFVLALLAGVLFAVQRQWYDLWPLALVPVVYGLNVVSYRRLGYQVGANYFRTRRGWLDRSTHIVPIRNMQTVVLRQTPWDRRHRVGTLLVDTAGQAYTGGGPSIQNVPWSEALPLARSLARRAAATRYRWR